MVKCWVNACMCVCVCVALFGKRKSVRMISKCVCVDKECDLMYPFLPLKHATFYLSLRSNL